MSKRWAIGFLVISIFMLAAVAAVVAVVDPFFHYHRPLEGWSYLIDDERYQNDGIVKHFDYNAIITGTSMTECFRTSEADVLFDAKFIKVPFSGSTFKEVDNNLRRAINANPEIKMVIRCLDGYMLVANKNEMRNDTEFPEYLYDGVGLNDVEYLLNKTVLFRHVYMVLSRTWNGIPTTSFDEYTNWSSESSFGYEYVLKRTPDIFKLEVDPAQMEPISAQQEKRLVENIQENVLAVVEENPNIEFYFYFPPYSIVWWAERFRNESSLQQVDAYRITTQMLLEYSNVHVFSFADDQDIILNLNNYRDPEHHSEEINSQILLAMDEGRNRLTKDNYQEYWKNVYTFFEEFDYAAYLAPYQYVNAS